MNRPLIEFENVYKAFGDNAVLTGVNLQIYRGQVTTVIGKSGGGKSVLLKHIIGLLTPDKGRILLDGRPLKQLSKADRHDLRMKCSYMFQGTALFDSMTVFENIGLPLKERNRMKTAKIRERVRDILDKLDIGGIESKYPSQLSGGMKKRVAMARALITNPEIVVFDEPTTGLDPIRKSAAHQMIADYQKQFGFTAVVVSHEIPDVFHISQRIAMLDDGKIVFQGGCDQFQLSDHPVIQAFIDALPKTDGTICNLTPELV